MKSGRYATRIGKRSARLGAGPAYRTAALFRAKQFVKIATAKAHFNSLPKRGTMKRP